MSLPISRGPRRSAIAFVLALLVLGACATKVQNTGTYVPTAGSGQATLPRPGTIYIDTFALDPSTVQLDSGLRAKLQRAAQNGDSSAQEQQALAMDVQSAISDTLVQAITKMGLNAVEAAPGAAPQPSDVVVQGQVTKITAGNSTRQNIIGFGAGKSEIFANVQVFTVQPDGSLQVVQTYTGSSNSGRAPGLGVAGASAAAGNVALAVTGAVAGTVSRARSGLGRDGEDLAKEIATNLGTFFEGQGWMTN